MLLVWGCQGSRYIGKVPFSDSWSRQPDKTIKNPDSPFFIAMHKLAAFTVGKETKRPKYNNLNLNLQQSKPIVNTSPVMSNSISNSPLPKRSFPKVSPIPYHNSIVSKPQTNQNHIFSLRSFCQFVPIALLVLVILIVFQCCQL